MIIHFVGRGDKYTVHGKALPTLLVIDLPMCALWSINE